MKTWKTAGTLAFAGLLVAAAACNDTTGNAPTLDVGATANEAGAGTSGGGGGGGSGGGTSADGGATGTGASDGGGTTSGGGGAGAQLPASEIAATFTVPEVLNIVTVANLGEVAQGQLAQTNAVDAQVKAFATQMVTEHTQALARIQALQGSGTGAQTGANGQQPSVMLDPTSLQLQRQDTLVTQDLQMQSGAAFDLAYMTAQIAGHAKVLAMLEHTLLPSASSAGNSGGATTTATSASIQSELATMRAEVVAHLVTALQVQHRLRTGS